MSSRRKKQKAATTAAEIAAITKTNPYIQRLILDTKIRNNVRTAAESVRRVYDRVSDGGVSARSLLEDRKMQSELRKALENLRDATLALTESPKKRRLLRPGRLLLLTGVAGGAALAASEKLRSKVLDLLFGAEEEFQYTPPPSTAPPSTSTPETATTTAGSPADTAADTAAGSPADTAAGSAADTPADTAAATGTQTGPAPGSA
jgi:hypothetical protein